MSIHEIIHYIWFYVWHNHFRDDYEEYDQPSKMDYPSEMVVESIMDDNRLSSINPYYPRENEVLVTVLFSILEKGSGTECRARAFHKAKNVL